MTQQVVIAGGGVGALEALLALQSDAGDAVEIAVLSGARHLTYRALSVGEPFGGDPAPRFDWDRIAHDRGVRWIPDVLEAVDPDARRLVTRDGPPVRYDALLLALGARPEDALEGAITFAGPRDVLEVREAIEALDPNESHTIAFVAVAGTAWTLPLYELALMTATHARRRGVDLRLVLVTRESDPLGIFGAASSTVVAERLAEAEIELRTATFAQEYADGRLWLELERPLDADLVIALPRLHGPALAGLPADDQGFVPVDHFGRVRGVERVWAVGDMTTRPLKQGGLAAQQADVAAADIAARVVGADVPVLPYKPKLQGMLLTGDQPLYLQHRPRAAASEASTTSLWWPPQKVAGRYLGPYLESLGTR
jgi:sulfide:quinone oxidoreductase